MAEVSVITPAYNSASVIERNIRSVGTQSLEAKDGVNVITNLLRASARGSASKLLCSITESGNDGLTCDTGSLIDC